jgi:hypothetical protein
MYIMCVLLFVGFLCNLLMHAVNERYHYKKPGIAPRAVASGS